jgi:protease-4
MYYRDMLRERKRKQKRSFDTIVRAVATGIFIGSIFLNVVFLIVIIGMGVVLGGAGDRGRRGTGYEKVYIDAGSVGFREGRKHEIAVIRIDGLISQFDRREGVFDYIENPVSAVSRQLSLIREDSLIKGVLLVIDSPGGTVTASDVLYHYISSFTKETGIPVVALMKQVAASGGYYVASSSQYIVAYPTSIVGSIGVVVGSFNFKELMDKYGVKYVMVKSGEHKGFLSPFTGVDDEDIAIVQNIADDMLRRFIDAVASGRENLTREDVERLADGRIYIAGEALKKGLIDEVGYFEDAVRVLASLASIGTPNVIEYQRTRGLRDFFGSVSARLYPWTILKNQLVPFGQDPASYVGIYYVWNNALFFR